MDGFTASCWAIVFVTVNFACHTMTFQAAPSLFFFCESRSARSCQCIAVVSMKASKPRTPRKEPIPVLQEWKDCINMVDLHPRLNQLSKLVTEQGLTWDQQVSVLRKLGKKE